MLRGRIIAVLIWLGCGSMLLWVLPVKQPTLTELHTVSGTVTFVQEYTRIGRFGDSYELLFRVSGFPQPFVIAPAYLGSGGHSVYQEVKPQVQVGESLIVWTTGVPRRRGCVDVWQLSKADNILISYVTMVNGNQSQHTAMLGTMWIMVGLCIAAVRQYIERQL